MGKFCFGIDVGGTSIKLGYFDATGTCLEKWEIRTKRENNGESILSDIAKEILSKIEEKNLNRADCLGIGLGIPGPCTEDGYVALCVNLGWGRTNVVKTLSELTGGFKVAIGNDANVAALGEMVQGGGKGYQNVVMITLGTGVGGGVVLGGKILTGTVGAAGEFGHILVNPLEESICTCGRYGCLEQYASATGVVRIAKKLLENNKESILYEQRERLSAKGIFDALAKKDEVANQAVDIMCEYLGEVLAGVATVIDPEIFVIGGGVSKAGKVLIDRIKSSYQKKVLNVLQDKKFALASLGNDAGIYGAAELIRTR